MSSDINIGIHMSELIKLNSIAEDGANDDHITHDVSAHHGSDSVELIKSLGMADETCKTKFLKLLPSDDPFEQIIYKVNKLEDWKDIHESAQSLKFSNLETRTTSLEDYVTTRDCCIIV